MEKVRTGEKVIIIFKLNLNCILFYVKTLQFRPAINLLEGQVKTTKKFVPIYLSVSLTFREYKKTRQQAKYTHYTGAVKFFFQNSKIFSPRNIEKQFRKFVLTKKSNIDF